MTKTIHPTLFLTLFATLFAVGCESGADKPAPQAPAAPPPVAAPAHGAAIPDWCAGHAIPESKCTVCNPHLIPKFKAAGDWCEAHGYPESACPTCNPQTPPGGTAAVVDWCGGHGIKESMCTKCNPGLVAKFKAAGDWCEAHGFPESACPTCNPQTRPGGDDKPVVDWCLEHKIPESKCSKCNPALVPGLKAAGDWCEEHGFPESACPTCNPQVPPTGAAKSVIENRVVRFRSPDLEEAAGIETASAKRAETADEVTCAARLAFDADRVADIRAIVPGVIRRVRAEQGAQVARGAPLFELESTRVGEIQAALQNAQQRIRTAEANLKRQQELRSGDIASARDVEMAEQDLAAAQAEARAAEAGLRMAGAARSAPSGRYILTAPISGTVVRRPAVLGSLATDTTSLATIADTSVMWALCEVPEGEASRISLGQAVRISVDSLPGQPIEGTLTWIAAEVSPRTRTVTARAEIPNPDGRLRANQFARAAIATTTPQDAVTVPRAAVQRVDEHEVVFVRAAQGIYQPRVVTRHGSDRLVQVEGQVHEGDEVVTIGAVLLRTEVMPGSIGAGCCEVTPAGKN